MKKIASLALLSFLAIGCATNSYHDVGLKPKTVDVAQGQRLDTIPHYQLQFCGVTSRVKRQTNYFYLKMFGNQFEEWAQFAFTDENGNSHRLELKMIEEIRNTYISREGISQYTEKIAKLMSRRFIFSPKLFFYGRTLSTSQRVTLVYMDILPLSFTVYALEFEKGKNWQMIDAKGYIDTECEGFFRAMQHRDETLVVQDPEREH